MKQLITADELLHSFFFVWTCRSVCWLLIRLKHHRLLSKLSLKCFRVLSGRVHQPHAINTLAFHSTLHHVFEIIWVRFAIFLRAPSLIVRLCNLLYYFVFGVRIIIIKMNEKSLITSARNISSTIVVLNRCPCLPQCVHYEPMSSVINETFHVIN